jgi:hypothetical protein
MYLVFVDRRRFEKCLVGTLFLTLSAFAQTDPGVRAGSAGAGGPVPSLSSTLSAVFQQGLTNFQEVEAVKDGLGPRFNSNSCSSCHAQPAVGGTSPSSNPQVQFANSQNTLPSFITASGPVREARYILKSDGTPDGGVHDLFTIGGRSDQPSGCNLVQENFAQELSQNNVIFRIPTPVL